MNLKKHFWLYVASFSACILLILNISVIAATVTNQTSNASTTLQSTDATEVLEDLTQDIFGEESVTLNFGRFLHAGGESEFQVAELIPQLVLNDDYTFLFNENNNRYMQTVTGTYAVEDGILTLFVVSSNVVISDEIVFNVVDANTLVLQQDLYESKTGSEFIIN